MTTLVAISLFYNRVRPDVSKAPTAALITYTRQAIIEFCEKSRYWREDLTPIDAVALQPTYIAAPPSAESVIVDVASVRHNGKRLNAKNEEWLDDFYGYDSGWRTDSCDQAWAWYATGRDTVNLVKTPSAAGTANIELKAVLKPSPIATTIAQPLYNNYVEPIAAGAKALLMAIPAMPWSDPGQVAYFRGIFDAAIEAASSTAARGYNRAPLRTRRPPF